MEPNKKQTCKDLAAEPSELLRNVPVSQLDPSTKTELPKEIAHILFDDAQKLKFLYENMPGALIHGTIIYENEKPIDFEFLEINPAFIALTGLRDCIGKRCTEVLPGSQDLIAGIVEKVEHIIITGHAEQLEYYVGDLGKWFSFTIAVPTATCFISMVEDISSRKNEEEDQGHLRSIISNIGDPIFVKDDQSRLVIVNDAFCEIFGLNRVDIIGKTLAEDVSEAERESFLRIDKEVLSLGVESVNEESLTVRNGHSQRISTRKTRFISSDGSKFLVGVIHDITGR